MRLFETKHDFSFEDGVMWSERDRDIEKKHGNQHNMVVQYSFARITHLIDNVQSKYVVFFSSLSLHLIRVLSFRCHIHTNTNSYTLTEWCLCWQRTILLQKEGKSHERKCYNQSMSHRKSIKCLHHSLSQYSSSSVVLCIAHFDWLPAYT